MLRLLKWIGGVVLGLGIVLGAVALWGPVEKVNLRPQFDPASIGPDLDQWLAQKEQAVTGLVPGTVKQVIWAGAAGVKTPLAVVYLHGFSASLAEVRPVADQVAKSLGANL